MGVQGDAGLQPRPGAAQRGRRRRRGARGGVRRARHDAGQARPGGVGRDATATASWSRWRTAGGRGEPRLMTVGSVPEHRRPRPGARSASSSDRGGFIQVDRVSRTTVAGVYAAGDCTGVLMLASVAAMQGRIAMWHALGEGVQPAPAEDGLRQRVHPPRDRHRRRQPGGDRRRRGARAHGDAAAGHQRPGQDAGPAPRLRQAVLPPGDRRRDRRRRGRARAPAS